MSKLSVNCKLLIVGPIQNPKYLHWLKEKYADQFKNNALVLGALSKEELRKVYAGADIFVFPSRMESFGLVLLEAMASRLPVVSTNVGMAKNLITDWENGFVISTFNSDDMAKRIDIILKNKDLRIQMGEKNRKLVESKFCSSKNFINILGLYNDIRECYN